MKYQKSKSTLFLMELMIAICFFAITSAVCVQVFAKAHLVSETTRNLNHAIAQSESVAESFRACNGNLLDIAELFPSGVLKDNMLTIDYGKDWQPCARKTSGAYRLILTADEDASVTDTNARLVSAKIAVVKSSDGSEIYSLAVQKFVKGT
ncbi:MAG: hypothetical protein KHX56_16550 [Clostridiales bacterium]|nr:hypothetical protein [Clostridiales bacterium]